MDEAVNKVGDARSVGSSTLQIADAKMYVPGGRWRKGARKVQIAQKVQIALLTEREASLLEMRQSVKFAMPSM